MMIIFNAGQLGYPVIEHLLIDYSVDPVWQRVTSWSSCEVASSTNPWYSDLLKSCKLMGCSEKKSCLYVMLNSTNLFCSWVILSKPMHRLNQAIFCWWCTTSKPLLRKTMLVCRDSEAALQVPAFGQIRQASGTTERLRIIPYTTTRLLPQKGS